MITQNTLNMAALSSSHGDSTSTIVIGSVIFLVGMAISIAIAVYFGNKK
jgi:hypothetical protein